jgi:hypothetical protein
MYIDGLAASMASAIAMAGNKVYMAKNARMMIHQSSGGVYGNASTLKSYGDLLESINNTLAEIYSDKTGIAVEKIHKDWMKDGVDKWFTATEALKMGLVDEIVDGKVKELPKKEEKAELEDIAAFYEQQLDEVTSNSSNNMDLKQIKKKLDLPEDATDEQVMEAIDNIGKKPNDMKSLLALAKVKGMDEELVEAAAKADFDKAFKKVNEAPLPDSNKSEGKKDGKDYGKSTDLADALAKIISHKDKKDEKGLKDYSTDELAKMKDEDPDKYWAL